MSNTINKVRVAELDDIAALVDLALLARQESPLSTQLCTGESEKLQSLLEAWVGIEGTTLLVADVDGRTVGFALVQLLEPHLFSDLSFMQIEGLFVKPEYRRRGLARNLIAEVAHIAEDHAVHHVVTMILTGSRQELRFLAGLGFAPAGARRVVDLPTLNRKLIRTVHERRLRGVDDLIARRRRSRGLAKESSLT